MSLIFFLMYKKLPCNPFGEAVVYSPCYGTPGKGDVKLHEISKCSLTPVLHTDFAVPFSVPCFSSSSFFLKQRLMGTEQFFPFCLYILLLLNDPLKIQGTRFSVK